MASPWFAPAFLRSAITWKALAQPSEVHLYFPAKVSLICLSVSQFEARYCTNCGVREAATEKPPLGFLLLAASCLISSETVFGALSASIPEFLESEMRPYAWFSQWTV